MSKRRGLSLVELCSVAAIFGVLMLLTIPRIKPYQDRSKFASSCATVGAVITTARSRAIGDSAQCTVQVLSDKDFRVEWVSRFINQPYDDDPKSPTYFPWTPANPPPNTVWDERQCLYLRHDSRMFTLAEGTRMEYSQATFYFNESGDCVPGGVSFRVSGAKDIPPQTCTITGSGRARWRVK